MTVDQALPAVLPLHLRADLRARAAYAEGGGIYRVIPAAVARPERADEIAPLLVWAQRAGLAVVPRGAGSAMGGGNVGAGLVLDTTCLDGRRVTVFPEAKRVRAAAGATGGQMDAAARAHGLRFPVDPSSLRFASAAGMVSTNAAGARSFRNGSVRFWVTGTDLVTADGVTLRLDRGRTPDGAVPAVHRFEREAAPRIRAAAALIQRRFPRTRKNSSGYALDHWLATGDLLDLVIGSEGTLGVITEVRWRLDPAPAARAGLRVTVAGDEELMAVLAIVREASPAAVEILDRSFLRFVAPMLSAPSRRLALRAGAMLLVEFEGGAPALRDVVAVAQRRLAARAEEVAAAFGESALHALWTVRHAASPLLARLGPERRSLQVIEDGCVPVERLPDYLAALRAIPERHGVEAVIFGHAGDGHLHVNLLPDTTVEGWEEKVRAIFDEVTAVQLALGGTPTGEHGDGRLRAGLLERTYGPEIVALFGAVKRAFDPLGLLNPGVILPRDSDGAAFTELKAGSGAAGLPADIAAALRDIERFGEWDTDRFAIADRRGDQPLRRAGGAP